MASSSLVFGLYSPQTATLRQPLVVAKLAQWHVWLPVVLCVALFAVESSSYLGSDHTSAPLRRLAEALCGRGVDAHWGDIHRFIRKTGHFMGYGLFSLLCFRGFWMALLGAASQLTRQLRAHGMALLATFIVAGIDEFHQRFLPNRCGQFSDVLLDTCGGVALCLLLFLAMQASARLWSPGHSPCA